MTILKIQITPAQPHPTPEMLAKLQFAYTAINVATYKFVDQFVISDDGFLNKKTEKN